MCQQSCVIQTNYNTEKNGIPVPTVSSEYSPLDQTNEYSYFGMNFDSKLTWKNHISKTYDYACKRLKILKYLAGSKRDCAWFNLKDNI